VCNCAEQCPACASAALMNLAGVLDRESETDMKLGIVQMPAFAA
jgi:hypothetical protein